MLFRPFFGAINVIYFFRQNLLNFLLKFCRKPLTKVHNSFIIMSQVSTLRERVLTKKLTKC